ncbi:hypothetical protein MMC18_007954, partial [Xylographa bjoerkii]|nr:hypothetical protein [Xylographa bjoerkii]
MLPAPAPDAPVTYKIVKVRKPDGTIVKVKRRITEAQGDATVPKPAPELSPDVSTTVSTQKVTRVQGDATVPEFAPNALSKVSMQVTFPKTTQAVSKGIVVPEASSSQTLTPKAAEKPSRDVKPKRTSKDGAKQRLTPARTYRLFRDVHRLHRAVETFDASGDLGDIRDDANDLESDPYSELSNSSSSDDDSKSRKSNDHGRKKNSFSKQKGDSSSVLSYHDSDSEYQQSDSDNNENQNQRQGASVRNNVSAGHSTNHTTTRETTSVRRQMMSVPRAREQHTTDASAKRSKSEVIINEKELGNEYDSEVVKARRRQFRKLKRRSRVAQSVVWGIMIVFPILFIVLGIFTALLNGVAAESWKGFAMTEAIKGAVTAWPIIFAAILAQSLKTFASYKVERGLRLMTLEQLISSHSVGAAIKQPFFLRNVNGLAIALLCLWSLSPLASQALQRMSYLDFVSNNATISVPYLDTTGSNSIFSSSVLAIVDDAAAETQGLYASSLMAPAEIQNSPLDTWNNTKIPLLEPLMEGFSTMSNGWYAVNVNEASQFSSLLGVPIEIPVDTRAKIPYEAKYSDLEMVMQSAYLTISDCTPQIIQTQQEINHTILQSTTMSVSPSGTLIMSLKLLGDNTTVMGVGQLARLPGILTFSSDTGGHLTTGKTADGNDITESLYSYTACKMTQAFVDSQVSCSGDQCRVIGMRPSLNVTQLSNFVGFYGDGPAFIES